MSKNKGGRSIKPTLTKFSPHPRIDLQTLRGLGTSEQDIREFRKAQRNIEKIAGDINDYSRKHGTTERVGFIDYPTAINLIRSGSADLNEITRQTQREYEHYKKTGRSYSYDRMIQRDIDEINKALGQDYLDIDLVLKLDDEEVRTLNRYATELFRYRKLAEDAQARGDQIAATQYWFIYGQIAADCLNYVLQLISKYGGE